MDVVLNPPDDNAANEAFEFQAPFVKSSNGNGMLPTGNNVSISVAIPTPSIIPYDVNQPTDPSMWDGNIGSISLFGTNEFLTHDTANIACSLQCMAKYIQQRKFVGQDIGSLRQLDNFADVAWDLLSTIYESGWDKYIITDNITFFFFKSTIYYMGYIDRPW